MRVRPFVLVAGLIALAAATSGLAVLLPQRPASPLKVDPHTRAAEGELSERALMALVEAGADEEVRLVATRAGLEFFVARSENGGRCYLQGRASRRPIDFGIIACLDDTSDNFPSARQPILDLSTYVRAPGSADVEARQLLGFAAAGVASVGLQTRAGTMFTAPVVNNVYASARVPAEPVVMLVAYDGTGTMLWSHPLGGPAPPPVP